MRISIEQHIIVAMVWTAKIPAWVAPTPMEVIDLHWLAYQVHSKTGSARCAGISGALAWVCGGSTGPATGRTEKPVTKELAEAEMWATTALENDNAIQPDLKQLCSDLGVEYWPPLPVERGWAEGVWLALRWLLGESGADAPLTLPQRGPDGAVLTADQLYERELARAPSHYESLEQRQALRAKMRRVARNCDATARLIEDTKRRLAVA